MGLRNYLARGRGSTDHLGGPVGQRWAVEKVRRCRLKAAGRREGALSSTTSRGSTKSKLATTKTEQASAHLEL